MATLREKLETLGEEREEWEGAEAKLKDQMGVETALIAAALSLFNGIGASRGRPRGNLTRPSRTSTRRSGATRDTPSPI
jgi:hypothetical protein